MRSSLLLLAALILSGCGASAAAPSPTAPPPTPAPTASSPTFGPPILQAGGSKQDYHTRAFHTTRGWEVTYRQDCTFVTNMDPDGGIFQIFGDNPAKPNGAELAIVYSMSQSRSAKSGTSGLQPKGNWSLHIQAAPGCKWHIAVREVI